MKAVVAERLRAPWQVTQCRDPSPGTGEIVLGIEASGVCYSDVHELNDARYDAKFPRIPGHEAVGRVIACGAGVDGLAVGDRVGVAYTQRWCGHCSYCAGGWYEHCPRAERTGFTVDGGHAQMARVSAAAVERVPDGLDPVEAAPLFCAGFTAYSGLCDAELRPGERCAVVGIGGLGHLAVQYGAALGAEIVAVTRSRRKRALLRELGADLVVTPDASGAGEALRQIGGVDVVVHTGNAVDPELLRGLRPFGRLVLLGVSHDALAIRSIDMVFGKFTIFGSCQGPRRRLKEVLELHERTGARTIVEAYRLDEALRAFGRVASGAARFRAVLVP